MAPRKGQPGDLWLDDHLTSVDLLMTEHKAPKSHSFATSMAKFSQTDVSQGYKITE